MALAENAPQDTDVTVLAGLTGLCADAAQAASVLLETARNTVRARTCDADKISATALEREQHLAHGLAWFATYVEALKEMRGYAETMSGEGRFGEIECLITRIAFAEYLKLGSTNRNANGRIFFKTLRSSATTFSIPGRFTLTTIC